MELKLDQRPRQTSPRDGEAAPGVSKSDAIAVNATEARRQQLYAKREQIYPKSVKGQYRTIKWAVLAFALAVYYALPWIRWDRGPGSASQAVLADFEGRRFYFFFLEIWPQEVYYITGLLVLSALALFLATSLFGRIWCGFACPQTVWTDLYIAVERFFEGDRNKRIRLDRAGWSLDKAWRKGAKHAVWLLIAAATGGAFVLYFIDAPTLARTFFTGEAGLGIYIFAGVLTFTTYMLAGTMREQVCIYMCPWPRIQGAMLDQESMEVTYREDRGEPRGPHKKGATWDGRGDCIDCNACVAACPMGIDIRDGLQLECINCGLCIDACNEIMDKVERPRFLIAYDNKDNVERREAGLKPRFRPIRPRTILYSILIAIVGGIMLFGLSTRSTLDVNVLKDRSPPFVPLSDGSVRNAYTVKIINKVGDTRAFEIIAEGPEGLELGIVGGQAEGAKATVEVIGDQVSAYRIFVTLPPEALVGGSQPIDFTIREVETGEQQRNPSVFQSPTRR